MNVSFEQKFLGRCADAEVAKRASYFRSQLAPITERLALQKVQLPYLNLAQRTDDLAAMQHWADGKRAHYKRLIVFGTGGSSLGGRTLAALNADPFERAPVLFVDNISPHTLGRLIETELEDSCFLAISKSGGTMETLCQLYLVFDALVKKYGTEKARAATSVLTGPDDSPMRRYATEHGLEILSHDPALGGRFSVLSNVGLLPAAFAGLDIHALRNGARESLQDLFNGSGMAAEGAAMAMALSGTASIHVVMTYSDRLKSFGDWFRQLWAESLGKKGKGSTPVQALGTVDQHSQLQLYLDGPRDKYFTLVSCRSEGGPIIPAPDILPYLQGKRVGEVLGAHARATAETLAKYNLPVRVLEVAQVNERTLGALFMHYMLETVLVAGLLDVDPYDQPAVEESKNLARKYLASNA